MQVTFGYMTVLFFTTPFKRDEDDVLEAGLQICLFMLTFCGLLQVIDEEGQNRGHDLGWTITI